MKVSTLYEEVAQLGFEDSLEKDNAFYFAANRAIHQVGLLRPHIAEYHVFKYEAKNLLGNAFAIHVRDRELTFCAKGARAYFFQSAGKGCLYIERFDGKVWRLIGEELFSSVSFAVHKGFIKSDGKFTDDMVRLRFAAHPDGDFTYFIKDPALYDTLYSENEDDISEYREFYEYDLSKLCEDFLEFAAPPMYASELERISGYRIDGGKRLLLPYGARGLFKILYRRKPIPLSDTGDAGADTTEIDLDEELCQLLPLLTAAYIWIEDEPEKAQYYMDLYRERSAQIMSVRSNPDPVKFKNESGW